MGLRPKATTVCVSWFTSTSRLRSARGRGLDFWARFRVRLRVQVRMRVRCDAPLVDVEVARAHAARRDTLLQGEPSLATDGEDDDGVIGARAAVDGVAAKADGDVAGEGLGLGECDLRPEWCVRRRHSLPEARMVSAEALLAFRHDVEAAALA